jgi:hypothetical protein
MSCWEPCDVPCDSLCQYGRPLFVLVRDIKRMIPYNSLLPTYALLPGIPYSIMLHEALLACVSGEGVCAVRFPSTGRLQQVRSGSAPPVRQPRAPARFRSNAATTGGSPASGSAQPLPGNRLPER